MIFVWMPYNYNLLVRVYVVNVGSKLPNVIGHLTVNNIHVNTYV